MEVKEGFKSWAIVEVMGHQVYAGYASDASIGGQSYLRVDVPAIGKQESFTKFLGPGSIFSITPTDEETARSIGKTRSIGPFDAFSLRQAAKDMAEEYIAKKSPQLLSQASTANESEIAAPAADDYYNPDDDYENRY